MRVTVAIVGLARSLSICLPSIDKHIIDSFRLHPGAHVSTHFTLSYSTKPLQNDRTGEDNASALDFNTGDSRQATLIPLEEIREESSATFTSAFQAGEWLDGSGRNLRNYLEFLTLLNRARGSVMNEGADILIFIRPDVLVLDRLSPIPGLTHSREAVLTPRWGKFYGLNDRMAVIPRQFVDRYFSRVTGVEEFIEKNGPLDPEKHLAWSLREVPSRSSLSTELVRVRAGGVLAEKDLERLETSGPYRRAQARKLRQTDPAR